MREVLVSSGRRWSLSTTARRAELPLEVCSQAVRLRSRARRRLQARTDSENRGLSREVGEPLLFPDDPDIVAFATDAPIETSLPRLDLNDPRQVADSSSTSRSRGRIGRGARGG